MKYKSIVLLTDFGLKDNYVGVLKGVIKSINRKVEIIDLNHNVDKFNIISANYQLMTSYKYFPKESIFVTIVDPGVGSSREIILVKIKDYYFISPNNGSLSFLDFNEIENIYKLKDNSSLFNESSNTFHGRDVIAKSAAKLAINTDNFINEYEVFDYKFIKKIDLKIIDNTKQSQNGIILHIDDFGNIITSITNSFLDNNLNLKVIIKGFKIEMQYRTFSDSTTEELFYYKGSGGFLEIAINKQSANSKIKAKIGDSVDILF